jgi:chromosome segregation ATPase
MGSELKKTLLKFLEEDEEFRYAVAGRIGLLEILKRLDSLSEEQIKLREEQIRLREEFKKLSEEQIKLRKDFKELREEQIKLREDFKELREEQTRLREEQIKLGEEQIKLREDFKKLSEEQIKLREEQIKLGEEQVRLREDFNKMLLLIKGMDERLGRVEKTLEKLTLDIEEEAKEIIENRLSKMGINLKLGRVELPGLELNLYGAVEDICVIGDASVRLGINGVKKLLKAVNKLVEEKPDLLRPKKILVLYTSLATEEALKEAEKKEIWVLKATGDLTKPPKFMH